MHEKPDFVLAGHLSETREARLKTYIAVLAAFAAALCVSWIYAGSPLTCVLWGRGDPCLLHPTGRSFLRTSERADRDQHW